VTARGPRVFTFRATEPLTRLPHRASYVSFPSACSVAPDKFYTKFRTKLCAKLYTKLYAKFYTKLYAKLCTKFYTKLYAKLCTKFYTKLCTKLCT
jgi:hypothetical protein